MFDFIVIGKGLIGSAATRVLSQVKKDVAVIGPDEPGDIASHRGVFASHYDQGRVTRVLDDDPVWAILAKRSIEKYPSIESESGINFHHPVGGLKVWQLSGDSCDDLERNLDVGRELGVDFEELSEEELRGRFPFFSFASGSVGVFERGGAGFINPRELIRAQLSLAENSGATIVRETATDVEISSDGCTVRTLEGNLFEARKVLIATGAFTGCYSLLQGRRLETTVNPSAVLLAEVEGVELERLSKMPTLIHRPLLEAGHPYSYRVPPTTYPDGRSYLKIGLSDYRSDQEVYSPEEIGEWFRNGPDEKTVRDTKCALDAVMPDLKAKSLIVKPCATTDTSSDHPYIDVVEPNRLFVAVGGCGHSAKSSVAIGSLAADLIEKGRWESDLDPALFQVRWER